MQVVKLWAKLLGVKYICWFKLITIKQQTLDWSGQSRRKKVLQIGEGSCRDLAIINRCAKFQLQQCIPDIVHLLVLSHQDYSPVVWSSASNKDLEQFKSVQNRAAWLTLNCYIIRLLITFCWSLLRDRIVISLLCCMRSISVYKECTLPSKLILQWPCKRLFFTSCLKNECKAKFAVYKGMKIWGDFPSEMIHLTSKTVLRNASLIPAHLQIGHVVLHYIWKHDD